MARNKPDTMWEVGVYRLSTVFMRIDNRQWKKNAIYLVEKMTAELGRWIESL